jgi:hypothetical protein|tara:strand:- start:1433 stop:1669 length:237 start_codon:yes stop_codon:yes gene_type:complete
MPEPEDFERNNRRFHEIVMNEEWQVNKLDVAELYLNDQLEDFRQENLQEEWSNMDGLTIIYVPGYGKLQMVWIEDDPR